MVTLERRSRRGPILTPSSLPCLSDIPTINITEGCAHECLYCYTRGYSNYPGPGRVVLFENTVELVQAELARKRRRPRRVYFSPSSDPFQPLPEVQDVTYRTMAILLEAGIEVAFLSKGDLGERFWALFAKHPALVFAQIGITTLDERLWQAFEPGSAAPSQRLETISRLAQIGIATSARLDPLIPDLTDSEASLTALLAQLRYRRIQSVAGSYLFLRPAFARRVTEQLRAIPGSPAGICNWVWQPFADGAGGGQMIQTVERRQRFSRLKTLAEAYGIEVHVCTCKNPDLSPGFGCQIAGPAPSPPPAGTLPLFDQAPVSDEAGAALGNEA